MDIFDDRNIAKLQFYQALHNSIECVTRKELNVDKTEEACIEKEEVHEEVPNEEVHEKGLNEEEEKAPLADIDAPTELDNSCKESADLAKDDERIEAWLTALSKVYPASKEESLPPPTTTINTIWDNDSGDEEETTQHLAGGTNPFRSASLDEEPVEEVVVSGDYDGAGCSAEWQMENFIQRIQCRAAVPHYALVSTRDPPLFPFIVLSYSSQSDSIFWLDKPKDAVSLHDKLPVKPMPEDYKVDGIYKIVVTEVSNIPTPHSLKLLLMLFFYRNRFTARFSSGFTSATIPMCWKIFANSYRRYPILIWVCFHPYPCCT